jgi:hypothetical protein
MVMVKSAKGHPMKPHKSSAILQLEIKKAERHRNEVVEKEYEVRMNAMNGARADVFQLERELRDMDDGDKETENAKKSLAEKLKEVDYLKENFIYVEQIKKSIDLEIEELYIEWKKAKDREKDREPER